MKYLGFLKFIAIIILSVIVYSCHEEGLKGEIKELRNQADEALEELQSVDFVSLGKKQHIAHDLVDELSPYFFKLSKASAKTLTDLSNIEKAHRKKISKDPKELIEELTFSIEQLDALYSDLDIDSLSETQAQKYYLQEEKILKELLLKTLIVKNKANAVEERYSVLIPKAEHLVDSITKSES